MIKQEKLYPTNPHHDFYASKYGWEYLGTDSEYDYYVNHERKYLSIVFGDMPNQYISPEYDMVRSGEAVFSKYPYSTLRKLIKNEFTDVDKLLES